MDGEPASYGCFAGCDGWDAPDVGLLLGVEVGVGEVEEEWVGCGVGVVQEQDRYD